MSNQLIPDQTFHSAALQYLGGATPASRPQVSGIPPITGQSLQRPPNALQPQQNYQPPDWLNQLLFGTGVGQQPTVAKPPGPALTQEASIAPRQAQIYGPRPQPKKSRGLFNTILDLSPGSPTGFMNGGTFNGIF